MINIKLTIAIMAIIGTIALTGCAKDENTTSDTPTRDAFIGNWMVSPTKATYPVTISVDPNSSDGVFIANFAQIGWSFPPASASISGNTITLDANQVIATDMTINGSGTLSGTKITWNYTILAGGDLTQVAETYTKQ